MQVLERKKPKAFRSFLEIVARERFSFYSANPDILAIIGWEKLQSHEAALLGFDSQFEGIWIIELKWLQFKVRD